MTASNINEWTTAEHALEYLGRADAIPHRTEGEATILELLPQSPRRILDLGCGDGRILALAKLARPDAAGVALDFSPTMLDAARQRFAADPSVTAGLPGPGKAGGVEVVEHNLSDPLPDIGAFDVILSSLAIHHLVDARKRALYAEIFVRLEPGGLFCNLEHVSSPTARLHADFFAAMGRDLGHEDPSNKCIPVDLQLGWLREIGFVDVDCLWKWRELALLVGWKPR